MDVEPWELLLVNKADSLSRQVVEKKLTMPEASNDFRRFENYVHVAGNENKLRPLINDSIREKEQSLPLPPLTSDQQQACDLLKQRLLAGVGIDWKPPEQQIDRGRGV